MAKKKVSSVPTGILATYLCLRRVRHGADRYEVGEEIDLLSSEAEHLLADGAIVLKPTETE